MRAKDTPHLRQRCLGVFETFEYYDQLYEWETVPEYEQQIEDLVEELL